MFYKKIFIVILLLFSGSAYCDQSVDDCILNGVRGINSDAAARLIKQSCENKYRQNLYQEFGEITSEKLKLENWTIHDNNIIATLLNTSGKTITLVSIYVSRVGADNLCPLINKTSFIYKAKLKPNSTGKFTIPAAELVNNKGEICLEPYSRLTRASRWSDISIGSNNPISDAESAMLIEVYSFKLGHRFEP